MSDDESSLTAEAWIARLASAAGTAPPTEMELNAILKLASVAAHSSERKAAPLACWIAGREGLDLAAALELAESIGSGPERPGERAEKP